MIFQVFCPHSTPSHAMVGHHLSNPDAQQAIDFQCSSSLGEIHVCETQNSIFRVCFMRILIISFTLSGRVPREKNGTLKRISEGFSEGPIYSHVDRIKGTNRGY